MVAGLASALERISNGTQVVVDGDDGVVVGDPDSENQPIVDSIVRRLQSIKSSAPGKTEPVTADGVRVGVLLNISDAMESEAVSRVGADGIGVYRTEFLYPAARL
jgi:phosphotransferase system enzyme I (PtsI)